MPLSNKERQRRWMEKNRAVFNLRRRNARKKDFVLVVEEVEVEAVMPRIEMASKARTIEELRDVINAESRKPPETTVEAPPVVYRNDYGGVISKFAWEKLQRLKEKAKSGGYEMDEYSQ